MSDRPKDRPIRTVELRQAFTWVCDDCLALNVQIPKLSELTDEDREHAYRQFHSMEDWQELPEDWRDFQMCWVPPTVTCQCGAEFQTELE